MNLALVENFRANLTEGSPESCWLWRGSTSKGYGMVSGGSDRLLTHRVAWILYRGPIPRGLQVLHRCDVRNCCNPDHLFIGTCQDNMTDKVQKGRQAKGETNGRAKLTALQVAEIRSTKFDRCTTKTVIAQHYGISKRMLYNILDGTNW